MAAAAPELIAGAGTAAVSAAGQGAINARSARRSYKFTKKLWAQQNEYNKEAFERENARQDYLLSNIYAINKQALKNAGYSTADPNGTGMQAPSVSNMDVPTAGQFDYPAAQFDIAPYMMNAVDIMLKKAQAENVEANTAKTKAETEGQEITNSWLYAQNEADWQKKLAEVDKLKNDGELSATQAFVAKEMLEITRGKTEAEVNEINEHIKVYTQQVAEIAKQIEVAQEEIHTLKAQQRELRSRSDLNEKSAEVQEVQKKLVEASERKTRLEGDAQKTKNGLRVKMAKYNIDLDNHDVKSLMYLESHGYFDDTRNVINKASGHDRPSGREHRWDEGYSPFD